MKAPCETCILLAICKTKGSLMDLKYECIILRKYFIISDTMIVRMQKDQFLCELFKIKWSDYMLEKYYLVKYERLW